MENLENLVTMVNGAKIHYGIPKEVNGKTRYEYLCKENNFQFNGVITEPIKVTCGICNRKLKTLKKKEEKKGFSFQGSRGSRGEIKQVITLFEEKKNRKPSAIEVYSLLGGKYTPARVIRVFKEFNINPGETSRKSFPNFNGVNLNSTNNPKNYNGN